MTCKVACMSFTMLTFIRMCACTSVMLHGPTVTAKFNQIQSNLANCQTAVQDNFAKIMSAYEDRTLSVWLEVAEQFGVTREAAARFTST